MLLLQFWSGKGRTGPPVFYRQYHLLNKEIIKLRKGLVNISVNLLKAVWILIVFSLLSRMRCGNKDTDWYRLPLIEHSGN